jgi:saccharopine dehydrogenase-like NADP-dependent oxidoreductase
MQLIRALYDWDMLDNKQVQVGDTHVGILDAVFAHCLQSDAGRETDLYGYALHVEVIGTQDGQRLQHVLTHTHPASDGSVADWAGLRAYTKCVGIPMAIGAQLIAKGHGRGTGVLAPELAFEPQEVFDELEKRQIFVHHEVQSVDQEK